MRKSNRAQPDHPGTEQSQGEPADRDDWDTPEFRRTVLIDVAFVAAPAVVMLALGQRTIAAAWLLVGLAVVALQSRRQIRSFWRSLQPGRRPDREGEDEAQTRR